MAHVAAVGWFVSPIVVNMINMLQSQLKCMVGSEDDLHTVEHTLNDIKAALAAAERRQLNDPSQTALLRDLKHVLYQADDLLDEIEYKLLKAKAKTKEGLFVRVSNKLSSLFIGKCLAGEKELLCNIRNIHKKLNNVYRSSQTLLQVAGPELDLDPGTWSQLTETDGYTNSEISNTVVFGRTKETEEIINMVIKSPDEFETSNKKNFQVIAVVGNAGIGKTTLARVVYDNEDVKRHFELRMWVCVSTDLETIKLAKKMIESASKTSTTHTDVTDLDTLEKKLQSILKGKRFLLVLDDVRVHEDIHTSVDELFGLLEVGARDSKILVTARATIVANILNARTIFPLKGLKEEDYWRFLKECTFGNADSIKHQELHKIGKEIAERLEGSPLSAKLVGAMLKDKLNYDHWMEIKTKLFYGIEWHEQHFEQHLRLQYELLPIYLKPCFAYCSIFPRGWRFDRDHLVQLWIAQGYIRPKIGGPIETVATGMSYFDDLLSRSFFVKDDSSTFYVIHDEMHDLADYISRNECTRIEAYVEQKLITPMHHIGIIIEDKETLSSVITQLMKNTILKDLRTLFIHNRGTSLTEPFSQIKDLYEGLKSVRALVLENLDRGTIPKSFTHFVHLRYLCLQTHSIFILPDSICKMYNLQVLLALGKCILPRSLSHLLDYGKLTFVQGGLQYDDIKSPQLTKIVSFKLEALRSRPQQMRFAITSSTIPFKGPWLQTKHLEAVEKLELVNCQEDSISPERLSGYISLKILIIQDSSKLLISDILTGKKNQEQGKEILPASLEHLRLRNCGLSDRLLSRCLQGLSSLTSLEISYCTHLTSFPSTQVLHCLTALKHLVINCCRELISLGGLKSLISLKELKISNCPKLKSLPEEGLPSSVTFLQVYGCDQVLMQQLQDHRSPEWHKISEVAHISFQTLSNHDEDFHTCLPPPQSNIKGMLVPSSITFTHSPIYQFISTLMEVHLLLAVKRKRIPLKYKLNHPNPGLPTKPTDVRSSLKMKVLRSPSTKF